MAELAQRQQALLKLPLAEEPWQAGWEHKDVGPQAECGQPAEAGPCAAGLAVGRQGSLGSAPAVDPKPDRDAHEVAGCRPEIGW